MRDASDLDARAIVLERLLQATFDGAIVPVLLHVDEIDDDEAGEIAQAQLPGDFVGGLEIRPQRGVLDIVLARGAAGVHVDGDERFRLVDDEIAARAQRDMVREHRVELLLDVRAHEDRLRLAPRHDIARMARHDEPHEVARLAPCGIAGDDHLVDLLAVEIADRALDERAFLVDEGGRGGAERQFAHVLPHAQQIFEVALHFGAGARRAGRAQDDAHAFRHVQILDDRLQALAVGGIGDLAGDAAAACGVRHQDGIATGERQIGGQRRALVAALFLHDLDEQHLAALDDFLDLVVAAGARLAARHFLERVAADLLDMLLLVFLVLIVFFVAVLAHGGQGGFGMRRLDVRVYRCLGDDLGRLDGLGDGGCFGRSLDRGSGFGHGFSYRRAFGRRGLRFRPGVGRLDRRCSLDGVRRVDHQPGGVGLGGFLCDALVTCAIAPFGLVVATATTAAAMAAFVFLFLLVLARFFLKQGLTVGDGDLVIVRVDFGEGEEPVPVTAIFDESRLKGRFDPCDLGEIDIAAERFPGRGLEVEFLDPVTAEHHNPSLLGVGSIDQHLVWH